MSYNALNPPPLVRDKPANEVMRVAVHNGELHMSMRRGFDDPGMWGILFVDAARHVTALTGRVAGSVRIAAFHTAIVHLVIPMLDDLHAEHPEIEPTLIELEGPPALTELPLRVNQRVTMHCSTVLPNCGT